MKSKKTIITALILIAAAILMILNGVGVAFGSGIELWRIALGAALLAWLVWVISDKKYHEVFLPLALMFMVFERNIALLFDAKTDNLISNWVLIVAALLLQIGFQMLLPGVRKTDHSDVRSSKGKSTFFVDAASLGDYSVVNDLGAASVFIENAEAYRGGGVLNIRNKLGSMQISVPAAWGVTVDVANNMGTVNLPADLAMGEPKFLITGTNDFGTVTVSRI